MKKINIITYILIGLVASSIFQSTIAQSGSIKYAPPSNDSVGMIGSRQLSKEELEEYNRQQQRIREENERLAEEARKNYKGGSQPSIDQATMDAAIAEARKLYRR